MAARALRHPTIKPAHPGEMLAEIIIPASGKSKSEVARLLHISRQTLYDILAQSAHDVWHAEREVDTSDIPTLDAA